MKKIRAIDLILFVFALVLGIGTALLFHACGPKSDGSWMLCHWAERVVLLLSGFAIVLAALKVFAANEGVKLGLVAAIFLAALSAAFVPGNLIPLCKMAGMECRSIFQPAVLSISLLLAALSLFDGFLLFRTVYNKKGWL
ncbi:MAG: DUF4418 family protein [Treponema sp.]|nr:DUF4418 family protein [Treponema sp.]